jgi:REP element-mobilizing transposase RayT
MAAPLAYLLTWTCYGTWLHGDARGSVDDKHNAPGQEFVPPNPRWVTHAQEHLRHPPVELNPAMRTLVDETIRAHCDYRTWALSAVAVRSNHVHVVVSCPDVPPETALRELKAWSTRRLREAGLVGKDARVWTHHGSTRYLWDDQSTYAAARYVRELQ